MIAEDANDLSTKVARHLPYLRRYARALTGNQSSGDSYAVAVLESVLADPNLVANHPDSRLALFAIMHSIWNSSGAPTGEADNGVSGRAQSHLAALTHNSREALLLKTIEGFDTDQIAAIMGIDGDEANHLVEIALREMEASVRGSVLVIEDEAIIAMDIADIVETMGHRVTGNARTHAEAVSMAATDRPDLILADIQLADNSSGVEAVNEILAQFGALPVIFITAFPERLLTGERPEPAFLINKPYTEEQIRSAVSQAMFFASTDTLAV
ncbi:response regulator [Xinfangfangia sp. CPCC 101601]|uniref:Response regulator n=1 Tax=Pseudogemmobacter lacusdianii TaxID=3069608 RepID=A0ABU0W416_9RHOB|nr:response regulator [Xinfangfangia sp. CPCC 101601]MDQ2067815.1 response regulator [Xinfangfangia sp. CPCC 101601]